MTAYSDSLDPAEIRDQYVDTITQEKNMTRTQPATTYYATTTQALDEVPEADSSLDVFEGTTEHTVRTVNVHAHVLHDLGDTTLTFRGSSSTYQIDMTTADALLLAEALRG